MFGHVARDVLLAINGQFRCKLDQCVRDTVSRLSLRRRGCRAGEHCRRRRRLAAETSSACRNHGEIPGMDSRTQCSRPRPRPDNLEAKAKLPRGRVEA